MKPSTPANKRKSVGGDSIKLSSKKRKSLDSNEFVTKSNGIEESPITPTPVKKIKMFGGTSQLNSSVEGQQKTPKQPQSKKLFKTPNSSNKKTELSESPVDASNVKQKIKGANENTDKASKPDIGTNVSPKKNKKQKKQKVTKEVVSEFAGKKKRRRNHFLLNLKERSKEDGKAVLAEIESKIRNFENRSELSKSAKRKLSYLKRMKRRIESGDLETSKSQDSNQKQVKKQKNKKQKKQTPQQESVNKLKQVKKDTQEDSSSEEANNEDAESDGEGGVVTGNMLQGKVDQDMGDSDDEVEGEENDSEEEEDEAEAERDESESEEDNDGVETEVVSKRNQKEAKKVNQEKAIKKDGGIGLNKTKDSKHRYVLFVSNLPFDATEAEISDHFQKAGKVISVRIAKGKDNRPRGFAYVELNSEEEYEKAFSMHHTFIKGRQIKVQYTKSGHKNSEQAKKEIKVKNAKLHALRKEGKLAGSVKQSQKRSFRRKKKAAFNSAGAGDA